MDLALNNLKRVNMPLNKETKPNHLNSQDNGDNFEMLNRIFHSFLNRNINIIMDHRHNGDPTGVRVISYINKFRVLVSLFNGISTFVGYLMSNLSLEKNSSGTI